jgi:hypothetical protein
LFGRFPPHKHPPGIIPGTIGSIECGNGAAPEPPVTRYVLSEMSDIFTLKAQ